MADPPPAAPSPSPSPSPGPVPGPGGPSGAAFAVDPEELSALARVLDDVARNVTVARSRLDEVRAGAGRWAVDGGLPLGLRRLLDVLTWAVDESRAGAARLAEELAGASDNYRSAELTAGAAAGVVAGGAAGGQAGPAGRDAK